MKRKAQFQTEHEMCSRFLENLPEGWTAYPEWQNWDIVLVRDSDGFQIGIEAKLRLNAKVVTQAAERSYQVDKPGPDCRAVLIPEGYTNDFAVVCSLLNLQIITMRDKLENPRYDRDWFLPELPDPDRFSYNYFPEFYPVSRLPLPEVVPTVEAGKPCPVRLTDWKLKAMKLSILLEKYGFVTRRTFKALSLSPTLFLYENNHWMKRGSTRGQWQKACDFPDLRMGFEVNYQELEQLFPDWSKQVSH
ncbi:hypothetical protein [Pseudovibrio sp. Tun.PSC04-5.I4]|uniref:hypothetical protein n=1 Tax=Pseudovibrio sp. Tun.PSC04-5.I4 TaxID=1798213 RepID=UPI000887F6D3|nr:hypothetical protein [Pseudovibrio sp. Tun.PSC04-5.I4]SDR10230.1 hypothetical protein SAMN04515695_2773 [Pseudovibrio sp. Tun.PSC04-5.I4]